MITELSFCWFNKEQRGHLAPAAPWDVISHIISKVCQNCQSFLSSLHFPLPSRGLVWLQIRCHHTWLGWAGLGWAGLGSPIRVSNEACVGTMGPGRYAEIRPPDTIHTIQTRAGENSRPGPHSPLELEMILRKVSQLPRRPPLGPSSALKGQIAC